MNNLLQLAPYGLGPLVAAYGAARGARSAYSAISRRPAYRKTRRVPRGIRIKGVHTFRRSVVRNLTYSPLNGLSDGTNTGQGASFTFTLQDVRSYINAASMATAVPSFADFTALFDAWRIKSVKASIMFQDNTSTTGTNGTNMPVMNYVWDVDDRAVEQLTDILQHQNCKRYQFGNGASRSGALVTVGYPKTESTGVFIAAGAITGTRENPRTSWNQTAQPGCEYNCLKIVMDPIGATQATSEGTFSFYFDIVYEFKGTI